MTFDELYGDVPEFFEPLGTNMIEAIVAAPCARCQRPTKWVEVNFEAHLCSPGCVDQLWQDYLNALEASDRAYPQD